jgi:hypothetical protein
VQNNLPLRCSIGIAFRVGVIDFVVHGFVGKGAGPRFPLLQQADYIL